MNLPQAEQAFVDIRKLRDYCLNPDHPRGKHKARVFREALGLEKRDAEELKQMILARVLESECQEARSDLYGRRYIVDFEEERDGKSAEIRTTWIIKSGENIPRLTSSYVL